MTLPPTDTRFRDETEWTNYHNNVNALIAGTYEVHNLPADGQAVATKNLWKLGLQGLQDVEKKAEAQGKTLRAFGSTWSLSDAAVTDGWMLETRYLNRMIDIGFPSQYVHPNYAKPRSRLVFAQAGMLVSTANHVLAKRRLSLPTCGASNGQTLAGAISTGTHSSAFDFGSIQDAVVGIHVVGANGQGFWIERASSRVTTAAFANFLGATPLRNDKDFDAALVSFGAFGLIHAYLIEAVPLFLLETYRWKQALNTKLWRLISTLDFSLLEPPTALPSGTLRQFEVSVDPYHAGNAAYVTLMYKRGAPAGYTPNFSGPTSVLGADALSMVAKLISMTPIAAPTVLSALLDANLGPINTPGGRQQPARSLGEQFAGTGMRGDVSSTEIGVDLADTRRALDVILSTIGDEQSAGRPFLGPVALRFVKGSSALLAFTRFPVTCCIELPSARATWSRDVLESIWRALDQANIPYTLHWGQENDLDAPRVRAKYSVGNVNRWIAARGKVLSTPISKAVFTNALGQRCGLT